MDSLPSYASASFDWTFPGTFYNAETNTGPNCSTDPYVDTSLLSQSSPTVWWTSGGQPQAYTASVSASVNFLNGQSVQIAKTGKFNMWKPKSTVNTTTGNVGFGYNYYIGINTAEFALHFGNLLDFPPVSPLGIQFPNSITFSSGFSGSISWLQVINSTTRKVQTNDVSGEWFGMQASKVLDNTAQFVQNTTVPYDSPALLPNPYPPIAYKTYSAADNFTMWLMFTPSNGHIVPLQKINWHWGGTGSLEDANWVLTGSDSGADASGSDATDYPAWTNVIGNVNIFQPE